MRSARAWSLPLSPAWSRRGLPAAFALLVALGGAGCGRQAPADGPLFAVVSGDRWGYIDSRGKTIIAPRFDDVLPFSEGLAAVSKAGRWGYIDRSGTEIVPFRFRAARSFSDGVAIVDTGLPGHPMGVIDPRGAWVVEPSFRTLEPAGGPDGLLLGQVEPGRGTGFYDRRGNLVHGPFAMAFPFAEGRARVRDGATHGILDEAGKFTPHPWLVFEGTRYAEGLIAVRKDGKVGYLDLDGSLAIAPQFDHGGAFSEGLAPVRLGDRWMFIDRNGAVTAELPAATVFALPLSGGLALATASAGTGRKLGYVDREGRWAIKAIFDEAAPFRDGLALVGMWQGGVLAYIDRAGKVVWETRGANPSGN